MTTRWIAIVALALSVGSGCASPRATGAESVRGQKFEAKAGCVRTKTPRQFEPRCDGPLLGYTGFSNPGQNF